MRLATDALQGPTGRADALGVATDCADADDGVGENAIGPPRSGQRRHRAESTRCWGPSGLMRSSSWPSA